MGSTANKRSSARAAARRPETEPGPEPVALEIPVVATGARPGDSAAKRALFTEEAQTVLVFEHGAVIRLSAAVADGQLLFLTNKKTGKEVVTQVIRKRSFRPTSCYVDLEFTEACPGFWGIEFPAAGTASGSPSEELSDSEGCETGDVSAAPPPDQHEVERLKDEVAELQTKLQSLTASGPAEAAPKEASGGTLSDLTPVTQTGQREEPATGHQEDKALEHLLAQEAAQEGLNGPKRLVAYPKKSSVSAVVRKAGKAATALAIAGVAAAAAFASYRFGILDPLIGKIVVAKPAPSSGATVASKRADAQASAAGDLDLKSNSPATNVPANLANDSARSAAIESPARVALSSSESLKPTLPNAIKEAANSPPAGNSRKVPSDELKHRANHATAGLTGISAGPSAAVASASSSGVGSAAGGNGEARGVSPDDYVAPKLVHAVKPVSPPEALRNYITGNVNVDALVDATGHVKSVTIVSGPAKLRDTAIDVMKQYVYEPALKNGKAVPSHVQASLQFWYEP